MLAPVMFGALAVLFLFLTGDSVTAYGGRVNPLTYLLALCFLVSLGLGIYTFVNL